ncbi:response regulator [Calidifontibacillus oryziterrae]|uniref:response regulator n=1 Tax=Calidifontibacillus oryziterrae TaxID=1191699 RepID=UPI0002DB5169|nr:response regulator [Calidifontibacillus oryziterrae]
MAIHSFRVLLIEDDPMVQEVNRQFIEKIDGFTVIGTAANGAEGIEMIKKLKPDLVFIDIFMPEQDGLKTIHQIRKEGHSVDIIAITAAADMDTVRLVLQNGAFDYIMKPFKFERIKKSLDNYRTFRNQLQNKSTLTQKELDELRFEREESENSDLPKGLNVVTLNKIIVYLNDQEQPVSAENVAEGVGLARVTARRYLEYLEKCGNVAIDVQYGGVGRPINRYITTRK